MDEAILRTLHQSTDLAREVVGATACAFVGSTIGNLRGARFKAFTTHMDATMHVTFGETPLAALRKLVELLSEAKAALAA